MLAALLYTGEDCVLSDFSAAGLWEMARLGGVVHVTVAGRRVRPRPGLIVRRVVRLELSDVRLHRGLPVTAPARTAIDCAAQGSDDEVIRMLARARVRRLLCDRDIEAALARNPLRPGSARVRRILSDERADAPTRSEAERMLLQLVAQAGLPRPETNVRLLGFEVDFLWRAARLVIEVDGYAFHGHRGAFEADRRRDQALVAVGYRVIRVTWRQLQHDGLALVVRIAQALAAG